MGDPIDKSSVGAFCCLSLTDGVLAEAGKGEIGRVRPTDEREWKKAQDAEG